MATPPPALFKCFGVGHIHTEPGRLYPDARCFGLRGRDHIDFARYYGPSQGSVPLNADLRFQTGRRFRPFGRAFQPSLNPHVPLPPEEHNPKFPRREHQRVQREDICFGVMTLELDAPVANCRGVGIEILFEDANDASSGLSGLAASGQEAGPVVLETPSVGLGDEQSDPESEEEESSWKLFPQMTPDQIKDQLKSGWANLPSALMKVGTRTWELGKTSSNLAFGELVAHPRQFGLSVFRRISEIDARSRIILMRSYNTVSSRMARWIRGE